MSTATASPKQPGVVIETVEGFLCINEGCDNQRIPSHHTVLKVDSKTGNYIVHAYCDSCGTLYCITRKPSGGTWGQARVEVVTDADRKTAFLNRTASARGIRTQEPVDPKRVAKREPAALIPSHA